MSLQDGKEGDFCYVFAWIENWKQYSLNLKRKTEQIFTFRAALERLSGLNQTTEQIFSLRAALRLQSENWANFFDLIR